MLATYRDAEDLVNIGAYVAGSNPEIDNALRLMPGVRKFLMQGLFEADIAAQGNKAEQRERARQSG